MNYQEMSVEKLLETVIAEEQELRFDSFSNSDAFELGKCIVDHFASHGTVAMEIFINGHCKFSYYPEGTNRNNATFLTKKRLTVEAREWSSLRMFAWMAVNGKTHEGLHMPANEYAIVGGSFPIRLQCGTVIGTITVSGLPHYQDHGIVVDSIRKYLGK